jgi:glycosyltransferase involved in cell wall biosynthesis
MNPLVTIIIPCYNYGRYLAEAIESALSQTYAPLEVLVINDGSTDTTREVASLYPVTLINQENQGAAKTFNRGIALAKGTYVVIVSADDKLHHSFVEKTVAILQKDRSVSFVYTHFMIFGARNKLIESKRYSVQSLRLANYITGTALIRKEAFVRVSGFDPDLHNLEDWDMWLTFAEQGLYGMLLPEPLLFYRQHVIPSRNTMSRITLLITTLKIWRRHKKICPNSFIFRTLALGGLYGVLWCIVKPLELLLPPSLRKKADLSRLPKAFFFKMAGG